MGDPWKGGLMIWKPRDPQGFLGRLRELLGSPHLWALRIEGPLQDSLTQGPSSERSSQPHASEQPHLKMLRASLSLAGETGHLPSVERLEGSWRQEVHDADRLSTDGSSSRIRSLRLEWL